MGGRANAHVPSAYTAAGAGAGAEECDGQGKQEGASQSVRRVDGQPRSTPMKNSEQSACHYYIVTIPYQVEFYTEQTTRKNI